MDILYGHPSVLQFHIDVRDLFHAVFVPTSFASVPSGVILRMHYSTATNLETAPPILKKCTEKVRQATVN